MKNPFDDEDGFFVVLRNQEGQYSLWPASAQVPPGWSVALPEHSREACLRYVSEAWTDMRPASLIREMERSSAT